MDEFDDVHVVAENTYLQLVEDNNETTCTKPLYPLYPHYKQITLKCRKKIF